MSYIIAATVARIDRDRVGSLATRLGFISVSDLMREALNDWLEGHGEALLSDKRPVGHPKARVEATQ